VNHLEHMNRNEHLKEKGGKVDQIKRNNEQPTGAVTEEQETYKRASTLISLVMQSAVDLTNEDRLSISDSLEVKKHEPRYSQKPAGHFKTDLLFQ